MNICVAGWYYHRPVIELLKARGACVVGHRSRESADVVIPNVGLEFHCYDWYLKNRWTQGDTLFTHDDNEFTAESLGQIAAMDCDQAFIFSSRAEAKANGYGHGRAIFCSDRMMRKLYVDGGFPYDETNTGQISMTVGRNKHDAGIQAFMRYLGGLTGLRVLVPHVIDHGVKLGFRGKTGTRLHLGCGATRLAGFVNIDMHPGPAVDQLADIRSLDYPENSVDEIMMIHVIEHLIKPDAISLLGRLHKMLRGGGILTVESPDAKKCLALIDLEPEKAVHGLFGDGPVGGTMEGHVHLWAWSTDSLSAELKRAGFQIVEKGDGNAHGRPWRDFRIVAVKP